MHMWVIHQHLDGDGKQWGEVMELRTISYCTQLIPSDGARIPSTMTDSHTGSHLGSHLGSCWLPSSIYLDQILLNFQSTSINSNLQPICRPLVIFHLVHNSTLVPMNFCSRHYDSTCGQPGGDCACKESSVPQSLEAHWYSVSLHVGTGQEWEYWAGVLAYKGNAGQSPHETFGLQSA